MIQLLSPESVNENCPLLNQMMRLQPSNTKWQVADQSAKVTELTFRVMMVANKISQWPSRLNVFLPSVDHRLPITVLDHTVQKDSVVNLFAATLCECNSRSRQCVCWKWSYWIKIRFRLSPRLAEEGKQKRERATNKWERLTASEQMAKKGQDDK